MENPGNEQVLMTSDEIAAVKAFLAVLRSMTIRPIECLPRNAMSDGDARRLQQAEELVDSVYSLQPRATSDPEPSKVAPADENPGDGPQTLLAGSLEFEDPDLGDKPEVAGQGPANRRRARRKPRLETATD